MRVSAGTSFSKLNGVYTNNGVLQIDASRTLTVNGSNQRLVQAAGSLALGSGAKAFVSSARFDFTGGVITGTFWAVRLDPSAPSIGATQTIGVLAWLLFAVVLLLRVAVGWRGRRAAIGTMLGFVCACAVLVGYWLRGQGGS